MPTEQRVDDHVTEPGAAVPGRRRGPWLVSGAVTLATLGLGLGLIAVTGAAPTPEPSSPAQAAPSSTPEASPTAPPDQSGGPEQSAEPGELTPTMAEDVLAGFLEGLAETASHPGDGVSGLSSLAGGAILEELEIEQLELADNGWTRSGTEKIVSLEVTAADSHATPPTATVAACIDSADVVILDSAGKPIASGTSPEQKRSINIYTLVLDDGSWRATNRTFPDDAGC